MVAQSLDRASADDAAFTLTAVGIDHAVDLEHGRWLVWVPQAQAARAAAQLVAARNESTTDRALPDPVPPLESGYPGVVAYLLVIWMIPALQGAGLLHGDLRALGRVETLAIIEGQWWRPVTALTLHADFGHILANSVFGAVIGLNVGRYLGSGFGWLLVLLAGVAGNLLNASLQPDRFASLGASTANFAAVGLVGAWIWRRGGRRSFGWRRSLAPLFAAFALLAFTGVGGEDRNVDVGGHFAGFGCGALLGALAARVDPARLGRVGQGLCATLALALVTSAWLWALGAGR
ncbi:MAG: rhomboid family intramembrane serine protease [Pseudomonadales bacterium]|nr:rhomboid family intramembrane serine protease [Pseudomonadales bacterium]